MTNMQLLLVLIIKISSYRKKYNDNNNYIKGTYKLEKLNKTDQNLTAPRFYVQETGFSSNSLSLDKDK